MSKFQWLLTIVLTVQFTDSYILLTANLEDVHEIAKQIVSFPIVGTLNNILRRASSLFDQQVGRYRVQKRADGILDDENNEQRKSRIVDISSEDSRVSARDDHVERRTNDNEDLVALGKNASQFLHSIKQYFEDAKHA